MGKLFSLMQSHLPIITLISSAVRVQFRKPMSFDSVEIGSSSYRFVINNLLIIHTLSNMWSPIACSKHVPHFLNLFWFLSGEDKTERCFRMGHRGRGGGGGQREQIAPFVSCNKHMPNLLKAPGHQRVISSCFLRPVYSPVNQ